MPISVSCPQCAIKAFAPDKSAGKTLPCPRCLYSIPIPALKPPSPITAPPPLPVASTPQTPVPAIQPPPLSPPTPTPQLSARMPSPAFGAAHSLGIGAMVVGIASLPVAMIPCLGVISLPLGVVGLLLGIAGLIVSVVRRGHGIGFPIAGAAISAFSLTVAASWWLIAREASNALSGTSKESPSYAKLSEDSLSTTANDGGITVTVQSAAWDYWGYAEFGRFKSDAPALLIRLLIQNTSEGRKFDYTTWREWNGAFAEGKASLRDNFENNYRSLGSADHPPGGGVKGTVSLYPGKQVEDVLMFEKPVPNLKDLILRLPLSHFDKRLSGALRLRIPAKMIEWQADKD